MLPWNLIAAVDIACEDPLIVALFTADGRYIGTFDAAGSSLSYTELRKVKEQLKALPTYIGPESNRGWFDDGES